MDAKEDITDQARSAWWGMITVLDDLAHELTSKFARRAFDELTPCGATEDALYLNYAGELRALGNKHEDMQGTIESLITARQSLIDWRKHDPTEDDRF